MTRSVALQISEDNDGRQEALSKSRSRVSYERLLTGSKEENGSVAHHEHPLDGSSATCLCNVDADTIIPRRRAGSTGRPPELAVVSHSAQGNVAMLEEQDGTAQSQYLGGNSRVYPTSWNPWPPSRCRYSGKDKASRRRIHHQRSVPQQMLLLPSRAMSDSLLPGGFAKYQQRSVSFPPGREVGLDLSFTGTTLGSLTTVASSWSGTSAFSSTRRDTQFTATLKSAELERSSAVERRSGSPPVEILSRDLVAHDESAQSVDNRFFSRSLSPSFSAYVSERPSRLTAHTSGENNHPGTSVCEHSDSAQQSSGEIPTVASSEPTSQRECGNYPTLSSGSRRVPPSRIPFAALGQARVNPQRNDSRSSSTSESLVSCHSDLGLSPDSDVTTPFSQTHDNGSDCMNTCRYRGSTEGEIATSPVDAHAAGATVCEGRLSGDEGSRSRSRSIRRALPNEACQQKPSQVAKVCPCPKAPYLSYVEAPFRYIPELNLGSGVLLPNAETDSVVADGSRPEEEGTPPMAAASFELQAFPEIVLSPQPVASDYNLHQPLRVSYSTQLQQALHSMAGRAEAASSFDATSNQVPEDL